MATLRSRASAALAWLATCVSLTLQAFLTGTDANLMIFYSFDGLGAPADVGPISTVFLTSQTPVTSELSNGAFTFTSGGVVTYNGSRSRSLFPPRYCLWFSYAWLYCNSPRRYGKP